MAKENFCQKKKKKLPKQGPSSATCYANRQINCETFWLLMLFRFLLLFVLLIRQNDGFLPTNRATIQIKSPFKRPDFELHAVNQIEIRCPKIVYDQIEWKNGEKTEKWIKCISARTIDCIALSVYSCGEQFLCNDDTYIIAFYWFCDGKFPAD